MDNKVVLIDNYDSFTWNVYQYLVLEGANVTVYRNDKITLKEIIKENPDRLVISPGPGHPDEDSGVSIEAIKYFSGKIPILGVCLGEQCIFSVFGGKVIYAGEIVHGKASKISHDGKGIFTGVPQNVSATRYHSLAGTRETLPDCLEVTSKTVDSNVIMGVRHKEFVIEGVQFHPESILTQEGRLMFRNFLNYNGPKWSDNPSFTIGPNATPISLKNSTSILDKIYKKTHADVELQKEIPGFTSSDFLKIIQSGNLYPVIDFYNRLKSSSPLVALLAEIKRASPSKGLIDINVSSTLQAKKYAQAGASAISVLTEPHWFKGSLDDLLHARIAVDSISNRPAILRKDFIFDQYQILQARVYGADSVLLIVKMLSIPTLHKLYKYSKSLGMEPLVEVNSPQEMKIALELKAKVIGVNNRDLHSFTVDLSTTSNLASMIPNDVILCALSGINSRKDVEKYESEGVKGILVGESLMRAKDCSEFAKSLIGLKSSTKHENLSQYSMPLTKICGIKTLDTAKVAIEAGADLIGIILVPNRKRTINIETAREISNFIKSCKDAPISSHVAYSKKDFGYNLNMQIESDWFSFHANALRDRCKVRPQLVGVFQDQPLSEILSLQSKLNLDIVQLHGNEPLDWAKYIPVPVIKRFSLNDPQMNIRGYHNHILLDGERGGTGELLDWSSLPSSVDSTEYILAGGLSPDNIADVLNLKDILALDVSSGVETHGQKDPLKIQSFIKQIKKNTNA